MPAAAASRTAAQKNAGDGTESKRGRPLKPSQGNTSEDKRRARVRRAQHAYRLRKEADAAARDNKMAMLEDTVEQMSTTFMQFADVVMSSETVMRDPRVKEQLSHAMHRFLELAQSIEQEADDKDSDGQAEKESSGTTTPPLQESSSNDGTGSDNSPVMSLSPDPSSDWSGQTLFETKDVVTQVIEEYDGVFSAGGNCCGTVGGKCCDTDMDWMATSQDESLFLLPPDSMNLAYLSPTVDSALVSSGWTNYGMHLLPGCAPIPEMDNWRFCCTLLRTTMNLAYHTLSDEQQFANLLSSNMFRFAMTKKSRSDLLYLMRWYLGPGSDTMSVLGQASVSEVIKNTSKPKSCRSCHENPKSSCDSLAYMEEQNKKKELGEDYLNAVGVEQYLKDRGARYIGREVVKIPMRSFQSPEMETRNRVRDAFSFNAMLGADDGRASNHRSSDLVTVPVNTLIRKLSEISIYMDVGPGYPKRMVDQAMAASIAEINA